MILGDLINWIDYRNGDGIAREVFGDKKELFAVYVGPFLSEDDIVNNMSLIQELSESKNGEISRWKL